MMALRAQTVGWAKRSVPTIHTTIRETWWARRKAPLPTLRGPSLTTVIARSASDEAIQGVICGPGLLRCARNDGFNDQRRPETPVRNDGQT
jgi:hypothetical protein